MVDPPESRAPHDDDRKLETPDQVHHIGLRRDRYTNTSDAFHHNVVISVDEQAIHLPDDAQIDGPPFRLRL